MADVMITEADAVAVTKANAPAAPVDGVDAQLVGDLVVWARARGMQLSGGGGLLQQLTKLVLESALQGEIIEHLGCGMHDVAGDSSGDSCNGAGPRWCSSASALS